MRNLSAFCIGIAVVILAVPVPGVADDAAGGTMLATEPLVTAADDGGPASTLGWSLNKHREPRVGTVAPGRDKAPTLGSPDRLYRDRVPPQEETVETVIGTGVARRQSEVSQLKGAGVGLLIGASIGAVVGYVSADDQGYLTVGQRAGVYAIYFGALGFSIGLVAGLFDGDDHASGSIPEENTKLSLTPHGQGASLSFSHRF